MPEERSILNHATSSPSARAGRLGLLAGATALMLFGMVAAFGTASNTVIYTGQLSEVVEQLATSVPHLIETGDDAHTRELRIQRGDTVSALLAKMDIRDAEASTFLRNNREADALFRQLVPGKTLTAKLTADGELQSLIFPLSGGKDTALLIQRSPDGFAASVQDIQFESHVSLQTAVVRHSLFGAADDAGMPDGVAVHLADIFGGDIDFHRDLRRGDRFSVIYETVSHLGKPVRMERILAAEFINDGKTYRAFWYQPKDGTGGYYTEDGRSVKKAFLRSPLEFSRISSGFSNARYHPVLKEMRAHRGIDFAAPTGTRVKAAGDGIVDFVGVQGGYGKLVILRHAGDKTTVYGHLSGFAAGTKKGARVAQGDIIGYVGSTGMATGPHLHYEFRVAGVHRNPLTVALPTATPLPQSQIPAFREHAGDLMMQISSIRNLQMVMLD
ncbi:MAG: peptidoglycan DD-metalloendopeptidase family protein [Rhodocyclaceae bacterium]